MAARVTKPNKTGTKLQLLQSLEKAYYANNESAKRRNTIRSLEWFSKYIPKSQGGTRTIKNPDGTEEKVPRARTSMLMRDQSLFADKLVTGNMYFAVYDPIHKDTLPVYDTFPLLLPWDLWRNEKNGKMYCISINMHYLPPALRFKAMKELLKYKTENKFRETTKLKISWAILKALGSHELFKHSVKMYCISNFRSRFIKIPAQSWEMAIFLPVARFKKGSNAEAWAGAK